MNEQALSRTLVVTHSAGLHMRPADLFAKCAGEFNASIEVIKDSQRVDGKSLLSILALGVQQGSEITIQATGQDAEAALQALTNLIQRGFADQESKT